MGYVIEAKGVVKPTQFGPSPRDPAWSVWDFGYVDEASAVEEAEAIVASREAVECRVYASRQTVDDLAHNRAGAPVYAWAYARVRRGEPTTYHAWEVGEATVGASKPTWKVGNEANEMVGR